MKNDEITAVGSIVALIIVSAMYLGTYIKTEKRLSFLEKENFEAKTVAVEQYEKAKLANAELKNLEVKLKKLETDMEEVKPLIRIKDELRSYSIQEKAIALAIGWTESTWNYNANHQGLYTNFCGNMPWYWDEFLEEKGISSNSAGACVEIYKHYKKRYGSKYTAIKAYKGIKNNTYLIDRTLYIKEIILKILTEEYSKNS